MTRLRRLRRPEALLELFVVSNLGFLAVDIFVAHSMNRFRHPAEWIPFWLSVGATLVLLPGAVRVVRNAGDGMAGSDDDRGEGDRGGAPWGSSLPGYGVGALSILVGVAGLLWHLDGHFFAHQTLRNLVYAAPFVAPLAYAGLGFLLLANRMLPHGSDEWATWVTFLAFGGLVGNFVLSLLDHAQNGFFERTEWIPVVVSALGVGTIATLLARPREPVLRRVAIGVLLLQIMTGILGFALHAIADLRSPGTLWERFVYGAPIFSPLLFADLALLTLIGIAALGRTDGSPR